MHQAKNEALNRACEFAKINYWAFLLLMFPFTKPAKHHLLIIEKLQAVADGKVKRLMFFLPPGSAKSTYANGRFLPWYLGTRANSNAILATHTGEFSKKWGRRSRAICKAPAYQAIFSTTVDNSAKAAGDWLLTNGSEYMSVGVGGSVTGNRADIAIIDDPVRGREDADSLTIRNKIWDWYQDDFLTRLKPDGAIVLIMTRWHEDDLAGRLLEDMQSGGEAWEVVSIPAECESLNDPLERQVGEILWAEWFKPAMFEQAKRNPRTWASLYQQRPAPEEGAYFKRDWLKRYTSLPQNLRFYGASDYAVTDKGGDYTVHIVAGFDNEDNLYLVDLWRGQTQALEWIEAFMYMLRTWKPQIWAEEAGVILKSLGEIIDKRISQEKLYATLREQFSSTTDKPTRARSLQALMQMGKVFLPEQNTTNWVNDLVNELLVFPAGKHDDQVDALSLLTRMLTEMVAKRAKETKRTEVEINQEIKAKINAEMQKKISLEDEIKRHLELMRKKRAGN